MSGGPIWYELMTPDPAAAIPFYRAVGGWEIQPRAMMMPNGTEYRMIVRPDGGNLGGVLKLTERMHGRAARRRAGWPISMSTMSMRRSPRRRSSARPCMDAADGTMGARADGDARRSAGRPVLRDDAHPAAGPCPTPRATCSMREAARPLPLDAARYQRRTWRHRVLHRAVRLEHRECDADGRGGQLPLRRIRRHADRRDQPDAAPKAKRRTGCCILGVGDIDAARDAMLANGGTIIAGHSRSPRRRSDLRRPRPRRRARSASSAAKGEDQWATSAVNCIWYEQRRRRRGEVLRRDLPRQLGRRGAQGTRRQSQHRGRRGADGRVHRLRHSLPRPQRRPALQAERGLLDPGLSPTTRKRPTACGTRSSAMAARKACAAGARTNGASRGRSPRAR